MVDLAITPAQVLPVAGYLSDGGRAGVAVVAGQPVYYDELQDMLFLGDANVTIATSRVVGVALHAAGVGQALEYMTEGILTLGAGAAPVKGTFYVLSATAGGIAPIADLAGGMWRVLLGVGSDNNTLVLNIRPFDIFV